MKNLIIFLFLSCLIPSEVLAKLVSVNIAQTELTTTERTCRWDIIDMNRSNSAVFNMQQDLDSLYDDEDKEESCSFDLSPPIPKGVITSIRINHYFKLRAGDRITITTYQETDPENKPQETNSITLEGEGLGQTIIPINSKMPGPIRIVFALHPFYKEKRRKSIWKIGRISFRVR